MQSIDDKNEYISPTIQRGLRDLVRHALIILTPREPTMLRGRISITIVEKRDGKRGCIYIVELKDTGSTIISVNYYIATTQKGARDT